MHHYSISMILLSSFIVLAVERALLYAPVFTRKKTGFFRWWHVFH